MLHALTIGIDEYRAPGIAPLLCARQDAELFAALLQQRIVPAERSVTVLVDEEAIRPAIIGALESLVAACCRYDIALVYFACHGAPERTSPRDEDWPYLITHDTDYYRIADTALHLERDVLSLLAASRARLTVIFLDACFSGASGGRTFGGPMFLAHRQGFRSEPISLLDLELGRGQLIVAAADDNEAAAESLLLGHGVLTYHLMEVLQRSPATSATATIGLGTLYEEVASRVREATAGAQHPDSNGRMVGAALPLLGMTSPAP
jgi:uncharacterized caspase-like protein